MAVSKPQIHSFFPTPVCVHYLPIAAEANAELKPLIIEKAWDGGTNKGWISPPDFESWGGTHAQTLFRVLRDLADSLTATRSGARVETDWQIRAHAAIRPPGAHQEMTARAGAFWSGVYYVDDGYAKLEEPLGGECELADPRGTLPIATAPQLGFRIPNGATAGQCEVIRPASGMIILHPTWLARGERRLDGPAARIAIEFDLAVPAA
jgi:hypothetical protein